jgi:hypothetical protein
MTGREALETLKNSCIEKFNGNCERIKEISKEIDEKSTEIRVLKAEAKVYRDVICSILNAEELM